MAGFQTPRRYARNDSTPVQASSIEQDLYQLSLATDTVDARAFGGLEDVTVGPTKEQMINAAIQYAASTGKSRVFIPSSMLPYNASLVTFNTAVKLVTEKNQNDSVIDVRAYGAVGDGSDETAKILAALQAGAAANAFVDLNAGTYSVTPLVLGANTKLRNGSLDFRTSGAVTCIDSTGGSLGADVAVTVAAAPGDLTLTLASVAGLASGDYLMLKSNENWDTATNCKVSEVVRIRDIAGSVVTLYDAIDYNYALINSPVVAKITYVAGWNWQNITLIGDPTKLQLATYAGYLKDATFIDCKAIGFRSNGFGFKTGYNIELRNPTIDEGDPNNLLSGRGYGVIWADGCHNCRVSGGEARNQNHAVSIGSDTLVNRWIKTSGMQAFSCTGACFDSHPGADHVSFDDLHGHMRSGAVQDGIISQAPRTTITNFQMSGPNPNGSVVRWEPAQKADVPVKGIIQNIQSDGPTGRAVYIHQLGSRAIDSLIIDGVQYADAVHPTSSFGVEIHAASGNISNVAISNVILDSCVNHGIHIHADATRTIVGGSIKGGRVKVAATKRCINIDGTDANSVIGFVVDDIQLEGGDYGVRAGATAGSVDEITIGSAIGFKNHGAQNFLISGANSKVSQQQDMGADVGNAAKTLIVGREAWTQRWNTPITANRTATLSTTGAVKGARFRILRTANCTGAFNVNVDTGPLKALATPGSFADVEYDGVAWILTGYSVL